MLPSISKFELLLSKQNVCAVHGICAEMCTKSHRLCHKTLTQKLANHLNASPTPISFLEYLRKFLCVKTTGQHCANFYTKLWLCQKLKIEIVGGV